MHYVSWSDKPEAILNTNRPLRTARMGRIAVGICSTIRHCSNKNKLTLVFMVFIERENENRNRVLIYLF